MKLKFASVSFILLALSSIAFAQSVVITAKKIVYKRPKTEMDYKKTFTVIRPQVKGLTPTALNKKVEAAISYEKSFDLNINDEIKETQWLEEAGYTVNYNKNGILDITLSLDGSGAYPSTYNKPVVVNLKTGSRIRPIDVFTNLSGLAAKARAAQKAEIKKAAAGYKKDPDAADFDGSEYFKSANITAKDLQNFTISDKGLTFIYDYGFPHVALALQPDGRFFYSWAQLKPFIKRDGLLGRFVR